MHKVKYFCLTLPQTIIILQYTDHVLRDSVVCTLTKIPYQYLSIKNVYQIQEYKQ